MVGEEQGEMRQNIENKREARVDEMSVTVMFNDSSAVLRAFESVTADSGVEASLSEGLTGGLASRLRPAASLSALLTEQSVSAGRVRKRSISPLSYFEKFSAEAPWARSAYPVSGVNPNTSVLMFALTTNNQNTEQRCCIAA